MNVENKMKKQLLIFLLISSSSSFAQECSQEFKASYEIKQASKTKQVTLWRKEAAVAYQNPNSNVTDFWTNAPNDRLKLVRLFDNHERGIEYEAKDYGNKVTWNNLFHKFSPQRLAKMKLKSSVGQGCNIVETYSETNHGELVEVQWLPKYQIAKHIKVEADKTTLTWNLTELSADKEKVKQQFVLWDNYYLTDYVDVGDNESDPFLAKMINMGFVQGGASGFYDSKGNKLGGHGHSH